MAKISYASMKLKVDTSVNTFKFNDLDIEVLNYLPIEDKYDLVMVTLQKSLEDGYYNPVKIDMYFHLHLIYMFTNISFTDAQRKDENKLYDTLKSTGLIDAFLENFSESQYNELFTWINEAKEEMIKYSRSLNGIIKTIIEELPKQAEEAQKIIENFDPNKYQSVINFAKAANGDREIM